MASLNTLFERLENSKLTANHYKLIFAAVLGDCLEFFDFFLIGFVLAFVVGPWGMSFRQSTIILLSSGVGAMIGAVFFGALADRIGRRPVFMGTILTFSIATGLLYFTPEGSWMYLALFRVITGFGVGGLYAVDLPLVQEFVPSKYRGRVGGIVTSFIPLGSLFGSFIAGYLSHSVGWRGLFLIGVLPAFLALLVRAWVPESPRWLISQGRYKEAESSILWILEPHKNRKLSISETDIGSDTIKENEMLKQSLADAKAKKARLGDLFKYPRSVIVSWGTNLGIQTGYYGFTLWAPTIIALTLGVTAAQAAKLFIAVTLAGFAGRWFWSFMSDWLGRKYSGFIACTIGSALVLLSALNHNAMIGNTSVMWLLFIAAYFFIDGVFPIMGPYSAEVWPSHLRASGMGSAYGFGGLGKIIGPMALAFFAGSSNPVSPKPTIAAITPAFTFLAALIFIAGIIYLFAMETKGLSIEEIDSKLEHSN